MSLNKSGGGAKRALLKVIATLAVAFCVAPAIAQQAPSGQMIELRERGPAPVIQSIAVRGNQRIEAGCLQKISV